MGFVERILVGYIFQIYFHSHRLVRFVWLLLSTYRFLLILVIAAFEVKYVCLDCTEGVVVADVESVCVLTLPRLRCLVDDVDALRRHAALFRLRGFLTCRRWCRLYQLPCDGLGLVEVWIWGFGSFFLRASHRVEVRHEVVNRLGSVERIWSLRNVLRIGVLCFLLSLRWCLLGAYLLGELFLIKNLELAVGDVTRLFSLFEEQIIARRRMIVFVGVDALDHVFSLEVELHELLQDHNVDRDLTQAYENTARDFFELLRFIPLVSADVLDSVPDFGVCLQNAPNHVFGVIARYLGYCEVAV